MNLNRLARLSYQIGEAQRSNTRNSALHSPLPSNFFLIFNSKDHDQGKLHKLMQALHFSTDDFTISVTLHNWYGTLALRSIIGLPGEASCEVTCADIRRYGVSKMFQVMEHWRIQKLHWTVFWKPNGVTIGDVGRLETLDGSIEWLTKTNLGGFI